MPSEINFMTKRTTLKPGMSYHLLDQVGAKMGKSTRPVYWGRSVIAGHTVVGDMLEWALWVTPIQ